MRLLKDKTYKRLLERIDNLGYSEKYWINRYLDMLQTATNIVLNLKAEQEIFFQEYELNIEKQIKGLEI